MEIAVLVEQYYDKYIGRYGDTALPGHLKTLSAILRCRTPESGMVSRNLIDTTDSLRRDGSDSTVTRTYRVNGEDFLVPKRKLWSKVASITVNSGK